MVFNGQATAAQAIKQSKAYRRYSTSLYDR
jgi:hypothetical protein